MINIVMDGTPLFGRKTGIGNYVHNLYEHLSVIESVNVQLVSTGLGSKDIITESGIVRKLPVPYNSFRENFHTKWIYDLIKLESLIGDFDIYHGTNFVTLPTKRAKKVITIHDLSFLKYPEYVPKNIIKHHSEWAKYSIEKCDAIIVDAESTIDDVCFYFEVKESKINCVHLASSDRFCLRYDEAIFKKVKIKYNLPDQFVLYVGTIESRKNISMMLEAFHVAKKRSSFDHKLILVGGKGHDYDLIIQKLNDLELENDVFLLGYVEDEDLPIIYNLASLFIYISLYEGFGLPLIEAMQSGVPVLAAAASSIPEIVEKAGKLVDPNNLREISEAIEEILLNQELKDKMIREGLEQAKKFSWRNTAKSTLEIYEKL